MILSQQQRLAGLTADAARLAISIGKALSDGRIDDAERDALAAFAQTPTHPEILYLLARVRSLRRQHEQAVALLLKAKDARWDDALIWTHLGAALEELNDFDRARAAYRVACQVGPEYSSCWFNLGRRRATDGFSEGAVAALRRAVAIEPRLAAARIMLANLLRADGHDAEAATEYRAVIGENLAGFGAAWWGLAMLKPMPLDEADMDAMHRQLRDGGLKESEQAMICFALAIAYEHRDEYAQAFEQLQTAHGLMAKTEKYDADYFTEQWNAILAMFPGGGAESPLAQGDEVIFIVSLPRSGSTLIEQILASHSQVQGGAELPDVSQLIVKESNRLQQDFLQWGATHTPQQWQTLGEEYLRRTARWRKERPKSTDKSPSNWQYIGAILAMLPNAKIVVARRDPLETCLACYRYLTSRHSYAHDFNDLARHWRDFDRAIAHWKKVYPDRVREQPYEDLVADPEGQIRQLLDFCNLPFEESCLNFHQTERRINTLSASQVREPLRKDTARAAKYGSLLDPLRAALGLPPFRKG